MAEAVFKHKVECAGLSNRIEADSAGTSGWHIGSQPHPRVMGTLKPLGIPVNHRARQFVQADLNEFDYVLVMDDENWVDVAQFRAGTSTVSRLLEYAPHLGMREVPDPYLTDRFEEVYYLVDEGTRCLLDAIRAERGL